MKRLFRPPLGRKVLVWLGLRTREVLGAADPKQKADALWRSTARHRYRKEILAALLRMTSGVGRCMYCEDGPGDGVEHRWPKSRYPERTFCWENLLVVCGRCNRHKLARFPLDERGEPLLIDPTAEDPADYLELSPKQGMWVPKDESRKGQETLRVIKLNRWELVQARQDAWVSLQTLLVAYERHRADGDRAYANELRQAICRHPFSALLHYLLRVLELSHPEPFLVQPDRLDALRSLVPEIQGWLEGLGGALPS